MLQPLSRPTTMRAMAAVAAIAVVGITWLLCRGETRVGDVGPTRPRVDSGEVREAGALARPGPMVPASSIAVSRPAEIVVTPFAEGAPGPAGHAVELTVVGPRGGAVQDVTTFLSAVQSEAVLRNPMRVYPIAEAPHHADDGVFLLSGIKDDDVDLRVASLGLLTGSLEKLDLRGTTFAQPLRKRVELGAGAVIFGEIRVTGGGLLPNGLFVGATPGEFTGHNRRVSLQEPPTPRLLRLRLGSQEAPVTLAGETTTFRLDGLMPDVFTVGVYDSAGQFRSNRVTVECVAAAEVGPITLVIERGRNVRAAFALWGQPIASEGPLNPGFGPLGMAAAIARAPSGGRQTADAKGVLCFPAVAPGDYTVYASFRPALVRWPDTGGLENLARALVTLNGGWPKVTVRDADVDLGVIDLGAGLDRYRVWRGAKGREQVRADLDRWGDARTEAFDDPEWRDANKVALSERDCYAFERYFADIERRHRADFEDDDFATPAMAAALRSSNAPEFLRLVLAPRKAK